ELLNQRRVLDARIVHQHINRTEFLLALRDHARDIRWLAHIRARIRNLHALGGDLLFRVFNFFRLAEPIEHYVRTFSSQGQSNAMPNAAGGARDDGVFTFETHFKSPSNLIPAKAGTYSDSPPSACVRLFHRIGSGLRRNEVKLSRGLAS